MSLLAVSTAGGVLAWIGLGLGVVVALVVVALFTSVIRPTLEIERYAEDILEGGIGIAKNLDDVDQLARTHELSQAVPGLATAYLRKVQS